MQSAYEYALPMRNLYRSDSKGAEKMEKVYDSTAINSTQNFASTIQHGVTPPFQQFIDFLPGADIPEESKGKAKEILKKIQDKFFGFVHESNFDLAIAEFNLDLATGTGAMLLLEGDDDNPLNHIAVPNAQIALDEGPFGSIDGVFRKHDKPLRVIPREWPDILPGAKADLEKKIKDNPSQMGQLLEGTYYSTETDNYIYQVVLLGTEGGGANEVSQPITIVEREMEEHPWIITRWIKVAGEVFGRGPLLFALPDIKTLNKTKQFILQRASFDVAGMWEAVDDGVMNPDTVEIFPGAIVPVAASGNLRALAQGSNMDVSQFVLADLQISVQKALLDEGLPSEAGPVRSPTEILERIKQLQQKTGTPLARYMSEFLTPWANRALSILFKRGEFVDLIEKLPKIDGKQMKAKPTSPLAQQQSLDEIQDVLRWVEISQSLGEQAYGLGVKAEDIPAWVADKFAVDQKLVRSEAERKQIKDAAAKAAQQQQQNAQAESEAKQEPQPEPTGI